MRQLGVVLSAVLAAVALAALVAMHGLPAVAAAAPAPASASEMPELTGDHVHVALPAPSPNIVMAALQTSSQVATVEGGADSTGGHGHSPWHLFLAILASFVAWALVVAARHMSSGVELFVWQFRLPALTDRSLEPPRPVRLGLLRC